MISRIKGKVVHLGRDFVEMDVSGIVYSVFVSPFSLAKVEIGMEAELFTHHYVQQTPSRAVPVLIGFINPLEREFFEMFISVSGIGPRAAIKAFSLPVSEIATAICQGDEKALCALPGIGKQKARQIIAKLQSSAAKFAMLQDKDSGPKEQETIQGIFDEVFDILIQLQYKKSEAKNMVEKLKRSEQEFVSVEQALDYLYRQG